MKTKTQEKVPGATPAPWRIFQGSVGKPIVRKIADSTLGPIHQFEIHGGRGRGSYGICALSWIGSADGEGLHKQLANAQLICAAPTLRDICREMIEWAERSIGPEDTEWNDDEVGLAASEIPALKRMREVLEALGVELPPATYQEAA